MRGWRVERRKLSELKPNKKNPRRLSKNDAQQLRRSIDKFGVCEPVVVNCDGSIIGGHQRVKMLKNMGEREVDVYVPEEALSDEEEAELNIRLNRNTGEFDFDILANEWELEDLLEWGFLPDELGWGDPAGDSAEEEEKEEHKCPVCGKKSNKSLLGES